MKKLLGLSLILLISIHSIEIKSQVTIGSSIEPSKGALLDLKQEHKSDGSADSSKGLGLPRVALTDVGSLVDIDPDNTSRPNPVSHTGLIVYNTTDNSATIGTLKEGVYMWDGISWQPVGVKGGQGGPWYQVEKPTIPSREVDTDSYLTGKATLGGAFEAPKGAALSVQTQTDSNPTDGGVNATKGLMLPRVELTAVASLDPLVAGGGTAVENASHKGLTVYHIGGGAANLNAGTYVWDGVKWVAGETTEIPPTFGDNGLTRIDATNTLELGGTLTKNTTINSGSSELTIESSGNKVFTVEGEGKMIKLVDKNTATSPLGKVLTADQDGVGYWVEPGTAMTILGVLQTNNAANDGYETSVFTSGTNDVKYTGYTGMFIDLPQGFYQINFSAWISVEDKRYSNDGLAFSAIFLSRSPTDPSYAARPSYLTNVRSIILGSAYVATIADFNGSGSIPIEITADDIITYGSKYVGEFVPGYPNYVKKEKTVRIFLWAYTSPDSFRSGSSNAKISSRSKSLGYFGPYVQLYALPFFISDEQKNMQKP